MRTGRSAHPTTPNPGGAYGHRLRPCPRTERQPQRVSEVYYAPFQLLQNVWEWHSALDNARGSVQELYDVRVDLGMARAGAPPLTGGVRPAVGFGTDGRSPEVRRRYAQVLEIANAHLPRGVRPIETWMLAEDRTPVRID